VQQTPTRESLRVLKLDDKAEDSDSEESAAEVLKKKRQDLAQRKKQASLQRMFATPRLR
jgi:hypothetical protein